MAQKPGRRTAWIVAAAIGAAAVTPSRAGAQDIIGTSFDQVKMLVRLGDTVTVTNASGQQTTGMLADLSSGSVALLVDGTRRDIGIGDVATIHQRRTGSLAKGAKIGFGIGTALGLVGGLQLASECRSQCGTAAPFIITMALVDGGLFAGIGVGGAAMTRHDELVYTRVRSSARVTVAPFATPDRRGVALSLGF
jgi:hypothetical protein